MRFNTSRAKEFYLLHVIAQKGTTFPAELARICQTLIKCAHGTWNNSITYVGVKGLIKGNEEINENQSSACVRVPFECPPKFME